MRSVLTSPSESCGYVAVAATDRSAGLREQTAGYRAVPAAVFADPQVGSVDTTSGDQVVTGVHMTAGRRPSANGRSRLEFAVGTNESVIVGAFARGPDAGEWIGQLTLTVRARLPIEILLDTLSLSPRPLSSQPLPAREELLQGS